MISLFPNGFNSRPLHSEKKNDSSYPSYEYVRPTVYAHNVYFGHVRSKKSMHNTNLWHVRMFLWAVFPERESTWWSVVSFSKLLFNPGCTIVQCLRNEIAGVLLKWMLLLVSKWISHFCKTIWPRASPLLMLNWWVDSSKQTHACKPVRRLCCFCSAPLQQGEGKKDDSNRFLEHNGAFTYNKRWLLVASEHSEWTSKRYLEQNGASTNN